MANNICGKHKLKEWEAAIQSRTDIVFEEFSLDDEGYVLMAMGEVKHPTKGWGKYVFWNPEGEYMYGRKELEPPTKDYFNIFP